MMQGRQKQPKQELLGFPMMTTPEVLECLGALGIMVHADDLQKPTPQSTQAIWAALLYALTGTPVEMFEGPKTALLGMMQYRELYSDSLQFIILYRHCRQLALLCGLKSFTTTDLTRPDPHRLRTVLSGVMNFAKFREDKQGLHMELSQRAHGEMERAVLLRRKLDKVEASIGDIAAKNAEETPKMEAARARNNALHAELLQMHASHRETADAYERLKQERAGLSQDVTDLTRELGQLQQQTREAKSRLVRSPDRLKRHLSEMSSAVAADRAAHSSTVTKGRELSKRLEVYKSLEADVRGLVDLEREIEAQRTKVDKLKHDRTALRGRVEQAKIEREGLAERIKQLERQQKNAEDRLERQKKITEESRADATAKIQALKDEYVVRSKERQGMNKERERILAEQKAVTAEMDAFVEENERELNELLTLYNEMLREAEDYMSTMSVKLGLGV